MKSMHRFDLAASGAAETLRYLNKIKSLYDARALSLVVETVDDERIAPVAFAVGTIDVTVDVGGGDVTMAFSTIAYIKRLRTRRYLIKFKAPIA